MRVLLVTDAAMERHAPPGPHPERPGRLGAAVRGVEEGARRHGAELRTGAATPVSDEDLVRVHDARHLTLLATVEERGGGWLDSDTAVFPGSVVAARLAAGATAAAARAAVTGDAAVAFAAVRPPGHHASRSRAAGFCLINNVAVAVEALRATRLARRIAIVDWDVHHGDGTQAIYDDDPELCYASTHEYGLYPGTGARDETGSGAARGTKYNLPLPPGSDDATFVDAWSDVLLPAVEAFQPEAILVSAGYDAHGDDPLARLEVTEEGYRSVSTMLGGLAARLALPGIALTLEGGYDLVALRRSVAATVEGLAAGLGDR